MSFRGSSLVVMGTMRSITPSPMLLSMGVGAPASVFGTSKEEVNEASGLMVLERPVNVIESLLFSSSSITSATSLPLTVEGITLTDTLSFQLPPLAMEDEVEVRGLEI